MATARMELKGARELGKRMRKLNRDVAERAARAGVSAGAEIIKQQAISNIRSSPSVVSGDLRDNVIQKRIPPGEAKYTEEYIVTVRQKLVPYAHIVEEGSVKMPAEPFLRPAFDSKKGEAAQAIVDRLRQEIDKAEL